MSKSSHQRNKSIKITDKLYLGKNAVILTENGNGYDTITASEFAVLNGITATAAEINAAADNSAKHEVVTTTNIILASETGKHFVLNSATAFVSTLPAVALGLEFWFHIGATEPTTSHTVVTNASANLIVGNITSPDLNAAADVSVVADADTISFIASKALHGDYAHVWCDGTNWMLNGMCKAFDAMTTTQVS